MPRRLLRFAFNGSCLLSLLACLGAGWLWWREEQSGEAWVEAAAVRADVGVFSSDSGLSARLVGRWAGGAGVWAGENPDNSYPSFVTSSDAWAGRAYRGGPVFQSVQVRALLGPNGAPLRARGYRWLGGLWFDECLSAPMPAWEVFYVPHDLTLAAFALPPILWLALRSRRALILRRRRRPGMCLRCGYDLTGNTSGRCSECGEAIVAGGRVTP